MIVPPGDESTDGENGSTRNVVHLYSTCIQITGCGHVKVQQMYNKEPHFQQEMQGLCGLIECHQVDVYPVRATLKSDHQFRYLSHPHQLYKENRKQM